VPTEYLDATGIAAPGATFRH